ncbi:MAG: relaxase/mobilization nuclease domain-containing protein [Eubacteriales bacterium]|nr:relaxase/mobilization nuclease domain-containing protein [Eubacteriales bacterium]
MAVTEIWAVHNRLDRLLSYVSNKDKTENREYDDLKELIEYDADELKTEQRLFVTGLNCEPENAYEKMKSSYALNDKSLSIVAYHAYQSFAAGEVDGKTAHEIGVKLAQKLWGDKFQVVVATHLNTRHFHNHFAICSTSFVDGSRYHDDKQSKVRMREASDALCHEYGLSVINRSNTKPTKSYTEWAAEQNGLPTIPSQMKKDIDSAVKGSMTEKQFIDNLTALGYTVKLRGREDDPILSLTPQGYTHPWRPSRNFGDAYTYNRLLERVENHRRQPPLPEEKPKRAHLRGGAEIFMKVTTLHGLYIHTLYQLGFIPKKSGRRIPMELREDILKLNSIIAETRLLGREHIDTDEQLFSYRNQIESKMTALFGERQKLRNRQRRCNDEDESTLLKDKISSLSSEIGTLRKEIKLCDNIAVRSGVLQEKLQAIHKREENDRKDGKQNEQFRRRS